MSVQSVHVSFRAWYRNGTNVSQEEFLDALKVETSEGIIEALADRGKWKTALIIFGDRQVSDFRGDPEPDESFMSAAKSDLETLGRWVGKRRNQLSAMKAKGLTLDVYVGLTIDQDQMEFVFPPTFLLECGQLGLEIQIITNE